MRYELDNLKANLLRRLEEQDKTHHEEIKAMTQVHNDIAVDSQKIPILCGLCKIWIEK